jgi:hypothetical protein
VTDYPGGNLRAGGTVDLGEDVLDVPLGGMGCGLEDMLKVVQHEQDLLLAQAFGQDFEDRALTGDLEAKGSRDGRQD